MSTIAVATFYRFAALDGLDSAKEQLLAIAEKRAIRGSIILAEEGINGTIAGSENALRDLLAETVVLFGLDPADSSSEALPARFSYWDRQPFERFKIKIKPEIVTFRAGRIDPNERTGVHVTPERWNELIRDPELLLIDTRNAFEVALGSFESAADPHTRKFSDFPAWVRSELDPDKHRKVAMFCTGGIRCEKATAYMLEQGFEEVYQLQGGILNYLERIPEEDSLWRGGCFVFDERVALEHGLRPVEEPAPTGDREAPCMESSGRNEDSGKQDSSR